MTSKTITRMAAAAVAFVATGGGIAAADSTGSAAQAPLSTQNAQALSTGVTHRVIVVLKDQVPSVSSAPASLPARKAEVQQVQAPVLDDLSATNAQDLQAYTAVNAVSATVSAGEVDRLQNNPAVAEVIPDRVITRAPTQSASSKSGGGGGADPLPGTCPNGNKVQLEPEALGSMNADSDDPQARTARSLGITGAGVKVGFIADGLDINNVEFIRKNGQHVFVDYKDFSGEGTDVPTGGGEAFLDAGSIAAQGNTTYDVSHFSKLPLNRPCRIRIEGVAPGASLVGLSIFGAEDAGFNSSFLQAIDYAVTVAHVSVLNESLGINAYPDDPASLDLIKAANDAAVKAGVTVTASSGDAGVTTTIGSPATDPNVLSVGASTTYRFDAQTGCAGGQFPGVNGWISNNISSLSSGGYTQSGSTVDLVAPGELGWAPCSTDVDTYADCTSYAGDPSPVQPGGGTSESAPFTAGAAALVIEAYGKTHGGAKPTPAQIKQILTSTANDIGAPAEQQGAGLVDTYKAVLAAEAYGQPAKSTAAAVGGGGTLLRSSGQFNAVAPAGTTQKFKETITNTGARTQLVALSTRAIGKYVPVKTTGVTLSDTASEHIQDFQGYTVNVEPVSFTVPRGADRLKADIAFQGASATDLAARVRLTLIDPTGKLAGYSLPQGVGNFGDSQVAHPTPGRWTAYIYSRGSADGGTTGPVLFGAQVASYTSFGSVSPSVLVLSPGKSSTVTLSVATPSTPGDTAGALLIKQIVGGVSGPGLNTVPVTLRSLAPAGKTSFSGVLTGGNGREISTGQANYYQFDLPSGKPELNAYVTLASNPDNATSAWLIDPSGNAQAYSANSVLTGFDDDGNPTSQSTLGTGLHVLNPAGGRWTLIVLFAPQVSGTALSQPFTVNLDQDALAATAPGLPNSPSTKLTAGHPQVVNVTVKNTTSAPESFFIDGRLSTSTTYDLAPQGKSASTTVPLTADSALPFYLVPTNTSSIAGTASTTGPTPIQFDLGYNGNSDPDVASTVGSSVSASYAPTGGATVPQGIWGLLPTVAGAFGPTGAPPEPVDTGLKATSLTFDPAVSTDDGDLWQSSIDASLDYGFETVDPGDSATIPVTITPTAPSGSVVSGTLFVDDATVLQFGSFSPAGNQLVALPYTYTVK